MKAGRAHTHAAGQGHDRRGDHARPTVRVLGRGAARARGSERREREEGARGEELTLGVHLSSVETGEGGGDACVLACGGRREGSAAQHAQVRASRH